MTAVSWQMGKNSIAELIDACTSEQRAIRCHVQHTTPSEEIRNRRRYGPNAINLVRQD